MFQRPIKFNLSDLLRIAAVALWAVGMCGCAKLATPKQQEESKVAAPIKIAMMTAPSVDTQRIDIQLSVQFDWWRILHSPALNRLIEQSFVNHPTMESVQSMLIEAHQSEIFHEGYFHKPFKVIDSKEGQLILQPEIFVRSDAKFIGDTYYGLRTRGGYVEFQPALLNQLSVLSPSLPAGRLELQRLRVEASYRTLASNLIACALQEASLRAQLLAFRKIVAIHQSLLSIATKRAKAGVIAKDELIMRQEAAEHAKQTMRLLKNQFEYTRDLLHFMLHISPSEELPESVVLLSLTLAESLPEELSATLIEQRPDVRAARIAASLSEAKYQDVSNDTLRDLREVMFSVHRNALALKAAQLSESDNSAILAWAHQQQQVQQIDYQDVLVAELNVQLATLRLIQTRADYLADAIVLYHAVGGAWWGLENPVALEMSPQLGVQ